MTELTKIFKHLSRDLLIYFLTGFLVMCNLTYVDYLFNDKATLSYIKSIPYWTVCFVILCYVLGHLIFALMYVFFEVFGIEDWFKSSFFHIQNPQGQKTTFSISYKKEIAIFENANELHEQFIERHTQLYLMRWNLAAGLLFSGITNLVFEIKFHFVCKFTLLSIIFILGGFALYALSIRTEKDCYDRVNEIDNNLP